MKLDGSSSAALLMSALHIAHRRCTSHIALPCCHGRNANGHADMREELGLPWLDILIHLRPLRGCGGKGGHHASLRSSLLHYRHHRGRVRFRRYRGERGRNRQSAFRDFPHLGGGELPVQYDKGAMMTG